MTRIIKQIIAVVAAIALVAVIVVGINHDKSVAKSTSSTLQVTKKSTDYKKTANDKYMNKINWQKSSENKAYPDLTKYPNAYLYVSIKDQRVYVMNGKKVLYTMYASTGSGGENATPTGTYHIQAERGTFFYNQQSGEGAKNWVSWKNHGEYLFHSVPTDSQGNFIESEAKELGKNAKSHGCVRLSVPDSEWVYNNVPEGMKVVITKN